MPKPRADIFQHPSSPVTFDPVTPKSIADALLATAKERESAKVDAGDLRARHAAILVLSDMVGRFGYGDVSRWLVNIGQSTGESA